MIDNVGDYSTFLFAAGSQPQNNYCVRCDRSISLQDLPDVIRLSGQYELPFGRNRRFAKNGWLAQVVAASRSAVLHV